MISTSIDNAAAALKDGKVIAIPTETVYGLAANIFDEEAIKSIFKIKERPLDNPLIVHLASIDRLSDVVKDIPETAKVLADRFWPGPLTLLLPKSEEVPDLVTAGLKRVGVRVPDHSLTLDLLDQIDFPLAAPSANPFKRISPTTAEQVERYFGDQLEVILDGGASKRGLESTIVGFEDDEPIIYRLGSISQEDIEKTLGKKISLKNKKLQRPDSPGMLLKHYSPQTPLIVSKDISSSIADNSNQKIGLLLFQEPSLESNVETQIVLSKDGELEEAASMLYNAMHQLDDAGLDLIIAERFPNEGLGATINDKLERASA